MQETDMIQPVTDNVKMSKAEITSQIFTNQTFKSLIDLYKTNDKSAYSLSFNSDKEWKNGLLNKIILITNTKAKTTHTIIVPIFSTEKTITWNISFYSLIEKLVTESGYQCTSDKIKCCLFFMDKDTLETSFMSLISLDNWIEHGHKGKNGRSVFFWNEKLPNSWSLNSSKLKTELKHDYILSLSIKDLKTWCKNEATLLAKTFNSSGRSEKTMIQNISNGLMAELWLFKKLQAEGHQVEFNWKDGDDLGIDILYTVGNKTYGIDVKTCKDGILKIKKVRQQTHYYAVIDSSGKDFKLIGYCHKWQFWPSKYGTGTSPEWNDKTKMYERKLTKKWIAETFVKIQDLSTVESEINKTKLQRKEQLFQL